MSTTTPPVRPRPPDPTALADPACRRLALASLRAEAEDSGRSLQAGAFHRLELLTEVGECLVGGSEEGAGEVASYVAEAVERLTGRDPGDGPDEVAEEVLRESSQRWGQYLGLIDLAPADDFWSQPPPSTPEANDAPSALDSGTLFRLLTGGAAAPGKTSAAASRLVPTAPGKQVSDPPVPSRTFEAPPPPIALAIDPELRDVFLAEGTDLFDRIESLVLNLEQCRDDASAETWNEIGRCFHTLKGAAGSVGLVQVSTLIHALEEELEAASTDASAPRVDCLHQVLHYLDGVFNVLRRGGSDTRPPVLREQSWSESSPAGAEDGSAAASPAGVRANDGRRVGAPTSLDSTSNDAGPNEGPVRVSAEQIDELMDQVSELITRRGLWSAQTQAMKEFAAAARSARHRLSASIDRVRETGACQNLPSTTLGQARRAADHEDVAGLLGRLAEQAEDLAVLAEAAQTAAQPLADNNDSLARTTLQLWESLQAVRIMPVRGLFQRLARIAHDAARVEGRQVAVAMVGEETGLDRAVQDKAFEPLLHVVRNAVSHGIEAPEERRRAGKSPTGLVTLEAARSGNTMILCVRDDGRGLDYAAIEAKGRRLGVIAPGDQPGPDRLNALIFQPGFSTREEANAIAGRGVGMDVVSQEVGRLHGTVELESRTGQGTRLILRLPARLALQQAMILRVDGRAFALPVELVELVESFDPDGVDNAGPAPRVSARGELVPLISARAALGLPPADPRSCPKLLMIRADGGLVAVLVDAIEGTSELVVKPLGSLLSGHPAVSGTSLSVTGEVVLTLNPSGLARWPGGVGRRDAPPSDPAPSRSAATVLVVDDSISVRKVVARQIRALGHEVEEVSDGLEALGRLRTRTYGLVVTDLEMPRMDGFELLAELARLEITSAVPVVVVSSRSDPETRRKVLALGAREFLAKPIDHDALAALVREQFAPKAAEATPALEKAK